ncbi:hypothetical protein TruAng_007708 [Truncatella angustata]|nr:hypothetical protein TruAng_007708 [Truncatella angustata]
MSALGQTGPNAHNSNSHSVPGLSFPQPNGLRGRGFPSSHSATPPKPSPTPQQQQHQSPYGPPQHYTPQQPPQGTYPPPLFSTTPSPVPGVHSLPNGTGRHASTQAHTAAAVAASRQRSAPQRHMSQSQTQLAYVQQQMSQQIPQQVQQQVQQQVPQSVQQVQPLQQTHQMPQQVQQVPQVQQVQPVQSQQPVPQFQQPQQLHQPSDPNLMNQAPHPQARHQPHPQTHQPPHQHPHKQQHQQQSHAQNHQQAPQPLPAQVHQPHAPLQPQPTQQIPVSSAPPQPQPEPIVVPSDDHHSTEMEVDSQEEAGDGDDISPKLIEGTPYVPRTPMGAMMSPPPEGGSYASLEAVHKEVLSYCTSVGYAVVIGRSKKTVPGLKKVLFVCDRAGKPPSRVSPEQRKRKTSSRKCNCPFGFFAIEQRTQWTIRYRPDTIHLTHNHGPSESPLLHPAARKLDSKMVAAVKKLKEDGVGVTQTLEILQQENPHVPLLPRDIYNARAAINRNPQKVDVGIAEERPAIYSKPAPSPEERIRTDLRRELQNAKNDLEKLKKETQKEIEKLKDDLREKDKMIEKFEMFIDLCNQRVMLQRHKLDSGDGSGEASASSS